MEKRVLTVLKEKISSKEDFLKKSIRYNCDVCGKTVTSLEIYDENDIVLCPQCEFKASYDEESQRPEKPFWLTNKKLKTLSEIDISASDFH